MEPKFDVIIVGGGLSGLSCAYKLARSNCNVLLLERGKYVGAKNMWGGAYYGNLLPELLHEIWDQAPFERKIVRHTYTFMHSGQSFSFNYESRDSGEPHHQSFTMLRARFDKWFADSVTKAGAIVASGIDVTDLYWEDGKVCGVVSNTEVFMSDVVILCEGVRANLTEKSGLRSTVRTPDQVKQGVKEVIKLPPEVIEDRFNLDTGEGVAWQFVGTFSDGMPGGAFIYTNRDSISVGAVIQLSAIGEHKVSCNQVLEKFKNEQPVKSLLKEGELAEYSAHLIPVSGVNMMPKLYTDGLMIAGDAAAMVVGTGLILDGANYAVASGIKAAETYLMCREKNNYSAQSLAQYEDLLKSSFVLKDLKTFRDAPHALENTRIYDEYPELMCNLMSAIMYGKGEARQNLYRVVWNELGNKVGMVSMAKDVLRMVKAL